MENSKASLFEVYLRLRPAPATLYPTLTTPDRFITVEEAYNNELPTHITLNPPNDNRRRAVEKFAFTKVFQEDASQLDLFQGTGVLPLVEGVLGPNSGDGRDGLLATLGVTGSGKVISFRHTNVLQLMKYRVIRFWDLKPSAVSPNSHSMFCSAASPPTSSILPPQPLYMPQLQHQTLQKHK